MPTSQVHISLTQIVTHIISMTHTVVHISLTKFVVYISITQIDVHICLMQIVVHIYIHISLMQIVGILSGMNEAHSADTYTKTTHIR